MGILLLQLGWLLAVPAFGGIDEYDHAYRAASVARGHWSPALKPLERGPGDLIRVPSDIVLAAQNRCSSLPYTAFENCHAVSKPNRAGEVLVGSTAARYNPIYPWLVGSPALIFRGSAALYVMRAMTTLMCDILLLAAWWLLSFGSATKWTRVGALTSMTPVILYATANAAPNGVEMCAGVLMWSAGIALGRSGSRGRRPVLWLFFLATAVVLTVHTTGPLWAVGILASLAVWPGTRAGVAFVWKTHRLACTIGASIVGFVALVDGLWSLSHATNLDWGAKQDIPPLSAGALFGTFPLWIFQTIGAIPFRDDYVPTLVFAISLVIFGLMLGFGVKFASRRQLSVMLGISVIFFLIPSILTVISYPSLGLAWQGRYTLPFACGLPLLCGFILDDARPRAMLARVLEKAAVLGFCLTQAISIWSVAAKQRQNWPRAHSLPPPSSLVLLALLGGGCALICVGMWRHVSSEQQRQDRAQGASLERAAYLQ